MKMEHMYLVKNRELIKELQYKVLKNDDKFLMVKVSVNAKTSSIKIDRLSMENMFHQSTRTLWGKLLWKVIPKIRGFRRKVGLGYGLSRRKLKYNNITLQGLLSILDPDSEEYQEQLGVHNTYYSLLHDYSWSRNNTQLHGNYVCSSWHVYEYLNGTNNKELSKEISDLWMKSKCTQKDRVKTNKGIKAETLKLVDKVEYKRKKK